MKQSLPLRKDVPTSLTWDMSHLYQTATHYEEDMAQAATYAKKLASQEMLTLNSSQDIRELLELYERYLVIISKASTYVQAHAAVDMTDAELQMRCQSFANQCAGMESDIVAVQQTLQQLDASVLTRAIAEIPEYEVFLNDLLQARPHALSLDVEKTLAALAPTLELPYRNYEQCKLADMSFPDFEVNGKRYPLSFSAFENEYEYSSDTELRRAAFGAFSQQLRASQHTIASNYMTQVSKEKTLADLRGYESVFDYLLRDQKVSRALYDEHLDTIMECLSGPMRRYAQLLQKSHGLSEMTFADLKMPLDDSFASNVSLEQAQQYSLEALALLGDEYRTMVQQSFDQRWYDFAQNQGKSTGGFCASPYRQNSYILMSWTNSISDLFTLVHEIGHAGHFYYAGQQRYVNYIPSLYFIEAPSTCNELLLGHYLISKSDDERFQRNVRALLLSNTYYHNFVTHFLEAYFQREVYRAVDAGKSLSTEYLHDLKRSTLQQFWGEAVTIDADAALTWMRQPHYYMGLYSYTYSAGLSIATQVCNKLTAGEDIIEQWVEVLKAGGSRDPQALAAMVDVDISDVQTLKNTIASIEQLVDQIS